MAAQHIKLRWDTAADWTAINPILLAGEVGLESVTRKIKIGDGSTAWVDLSYWAAGGVGSGDMLKSVYDTDDDGKVDVAETAALAADSDKVDGEHASAFADASHGNAQHSSTFITAADVHSNANDPAAGEKAALPGTSGTPSGSNKYVTNEDGRLASYDAAYKCLVFTI